MTPSMNGGKHRSTGSMSQSLFHFIYLALFGKDARADFSSCHDLDVCLCAGKRPR